MKSEHALRMVRAIAALTLMRASELQEIDGTSWSSTSARAPRLEEGQARRLPARVKSWITEPVAQAVAAAERLSWHDSHLRRAGADFVRSAVGAGIWLPATLKVITANRLKVRPE
uniref:hypothetical protein n=1 Tax=Streptomyces sp. NBC_01001 TaxID=2903713 RepID=UPI002F919B6C|nr:hypothetical protein OG296_43060 [Streptomyces sp. NBC_01001]